MKRLLQSSFSVSGYVALAIAVNHVYAQQSLNPLAESLSSPVAVGTASESKALNLSTQVNDLFLNQWVQTDKDHNVRGSAVALLGSDTASLQKVRVSLLQAGNVVVFDDTDIDGEFLIEGVLPGVYTLVAETGSSLSIFSLTNRATSAAPPYLFPSATIIKPNCFCRNCAFLRCKTKSSIVPSFSGIKTPPAPEPKHSLAPSLRPVPPAPECRRHQP